ncbi:MAG: threonylcarbamoyl-AMP synthase [Bacteroidales bacterium]|nr:threonylcarbamoyl-AMP synthase [Bacteroidales bacterium]MBN2758155.1 threonylcarbamoyl-AMP synthase [Bacteroidales bacterium]
MLIKIYEDNTSRDMIIQVVDVLRRGGLVIYPTDTVYGLGCDINNHRAIEKLAKIKGIDLKKANFSFICYDLSSLAEYSKPIGNNIFKIMKRNLPGPFTFILEASNKVPKILKNKKKTVGIRVPNNNIIREIVKELGNPILTTSIRDDNDVIEYLTDPELIHEKYEEIADIVIDGGYGNTIASTIIDCTNNEIEIIRKGELDLIL